MAVVYNTPRKASTVALLLTNCLEVAKFLHRQNQSVQVNAVYIYAHPSLPTPIREIGTAWENFANL